MNLKFEISEAEVEKLDELMKESGIDSYRDLFNTSLTLFQWAIQQTKEGKVVASVDETAQKYTEVQMDALIYVAEKHTEKNSSVNA